jgi:hypothetical protein
VPFAELPSGARLTASWLNQNQFFPSRKQRANCANRIKIADLECRGIVLKQTLEADELLSRSAALMSALYQSYNADARLTAVLDG